MSRIDLYPNRSASPQDAQVATGTVVGNKVALDTQIVGGSVVVGTAAVPADYDFAEVLYSTLTQEIYIYRKNGNIVRTVTINYTSSTKEYISDWSIL